jgi:hypothetical protein
MEKHFDITLLSDRKKDNTVQIEVVICKVGHTVLTSKGNVAKGTLNLLTGEGRVSENIPCKCAVDKQAKFITEFTVKPDMLKKMNDALNTVIHL